MQRHGDQALKTIALWDLFETCMWDGRHQRSSSWVWEDIGGKNISRILPKQHSDSTVKPGYHLESLISFQTSRPRDLFLMACLAFSCPGHQGHCDDGEKPPELTDTWLCLSTSEISFVPPFQATAQGSSHPSFLKSHATNHLVHGCVSWGCWVTSNYPPKGSEGGLMLEIPGMIQQGIDYVNQTS